MAFTEAEKRKWHADRKSGRNRDAQPPAQTCAHCRAPISYGDPNSAFPLCAACE